MNVELTAKIYGTYAESLFNSFLNMEDKDEWLKEATELLNIYDKKVTKEHLENILSYFTMFHGKIYEQFGQGSILEQYENLLYKIDWVVRDRIMGLELDEYLDKIAKERDSKK